jgi:hypothetical protein
MKNTVLILLLLITSSVCGQAYHPLIRPNTFWDVHHGDGSQICNVSDGHQYFFEGDTVIMGMEYAIIRAHPIVSLLPVPYCPPYAIDSTTSTIAAFMREDTSAQRVFVFDQSNQQDALLYDHGLQAGDTLNSEYAGQGGTLIVDSIGTTELLDGSGRRVFYLNNGGFYIESIGGSQGLWFPLTMGISFSNIPLCVRENGVQLWGAQCFGYLGTVGLTDVTVPDHLAVTPNPANGTILITMGDEHATFALFDMTGREVLRKQLQTSTGTVNISNLPPGSYIYHFSPQMIKGKLVIE